MTAMNLIHVAKTEVLNKDLLLNLMYLFLELKGFSCFEIIATEKK